MVKIYSIIILLLISGCNTSKPFHGIDTEGQKDFRNNITEIEIDTAPMFASTDGNVSCGFLYFFFDGFIDTLKITDRKIISDFISLIKNSDVAP